MMDYVVREKFSFCLLSWREVSIHLFRVDRFRCKCQLCLGKGMGTSEGEKQVEGCLSGYHLLLDLWETWLKFVV